MSSFKESKLKPVLSTFFILDITKGLAEARARLPGLTSFALCEEGGWRNQQGCWEIQENFLSTFIYILHLPKMKALGAVEGRRKQLHLDSKQLTELNGH